MYAIEFEADIKNGIVQIPDQYKELQEKEHAKFIVLIDNINEMKKKEKMTSISIDTLGKRFNREEANER